MQAGSEPGWLQRRKVYRRFVDTYVEAVVLLSKAVKEKVPINLETSRKQHNQHTWSSWFFFFIALPQIMQRNAGKV